MEEKEILMPVLVLFDGCRDCERLDIRVDQKKLYADGEIVAKTNDLRCTSLYECKRYVKIVEKAMNKDS